MSTKRDYYEILGIGRDASEDAVKKAYRKLAMQNHPDRNPGDKQAEERFREASEAYQVLSDQERRAQYDRFGHAAFEQNAGFGGFDFGGGFAEDLFNDLFGELFGGRNRSRSRSRRGDDLRYDLEIAFEEAAEGAEKTIEIPRLSACDACHGSGSSDGGARATCTGCQGSGQVRYQQGFFTIAKTCNECGGQGSVVKNPCGQCRGAGVTQRAVALNVRIPPGVDSGTRLKLRGEGGTGQAGGPAGDLYVVLSVREHPLFARDGSNIVCEIPITFPEAALGAEIEVPTLGGKVMMKVPAGTQSGSVFRLKGKGVTDPRGYGRGDQLVRVLVEVPRSLTPHQRELLTEFARDLHKEVNPLSKGFFDKVKEMFG